MADMATAEGVLLDREFWLQRGEGLRAAERSMADLLRDWAAVDRAAVDRASPEAVVVHALPEATAARFAAAAGAEPILNWAALAGAAAVVLRRFGAEGPVALLTGAPLPVRLPVLLVPRPAVAFREWLSDVATATAEALIHKDAATAAGARDRLGWPEERTAIGVGGTPIGGEPVAGGGRGAGTAYGGGPAAITLDLTAGRVTAASALVPRAILQALACAIVTVLDQGLADPGRPLHSIGVLDPGAMDRAGTEPAETPDPPDFREAVLARAAERPEALAVHDPSGSVTYRDLCATALGAAHRLREAGVGPGAAVALLAERDIRSVTAAVGVLFSGCALLALDPALAADRRDALLRAAHTVIASDVAGLPSDSHPRRLGLTDLLDAARADGPTGLAEPSGGSPDPCDPAYLSAPTPPARTAQPVWVDHGAFRRSLALRVRDLDLRPGAEDRQTAPAGTPEAMEQMFAALTVGATVRMVVDGGSCRPAAEPTSGYRLAEVAGPVGDPVPSAGMRIYVLDDDLQPLPTGITGNVYVAGDRVACGYVDDPAATALDFLPDPFAAGSGARMHRTGDRGRRRADGRVDIVGRRATRTTVGGRRVDLGEIERVFRARPGVARAAVAVIDDVDGERLIAFVTARSGSDLDGEALAADAADLLPPHLVPHELRIVDALPVGVDGEIDREGLRTLVAEPAWDTDALVPPRTETERVLCELWMRHLGLDDVGVTEDFFALGGDSILGIKIVREAELRGLRLRPRHVLEHRTIAEMAAVADEARANDDGADSGARTGGATVGTAAPGGSIGEPTAPGTLAPLAPAQHAFFARGLSRPHHWNNSLRYPALRPLDVERVRQAVRQLADRHPALRTRVVETSPGTRYQQIADEPPRVSEVDLRGVPAVESLDHLAAAATRLHLALDLSEGPIGWFAVVRMPSGVPDQLLVILHHAVVDLYSWDVLAEDLSALLSGGAGATPATTPFPTWCARLAEHTARHPGDFDVSYWTGRDWSGCAEVVPGGARDPEHGSIELSTTLGPAATGPLLAKRHGGRNALYEHLVGALGTALAGWLSTDATGIPVLLGAHGREDIFPEIDLSRSIGWFTTTYPFLLPLPAPGEPGTRYTERVAADLRTVPRNGFDYAALRYLATDDALRARLAALPAPQVAFDFARVGVTRDEDRIGPLGPPRGDATGEDRPRDALRDFAVQVFTKLSGDSLAVTVRCSGGLIPWDRLEALTEAFVMAVVAA